MIFHSDAFSNLVWKGNRISEECAHELKEFTKKIKQLRSKKRKLDQQAILLILLTHYKPSKESPFDLLPLEIKHVIIQIVLDDMPAAELKTWL